jgi:hypothetical protein
MMWGRKIPWCDPWDLPTNRLQKWISRENWAQIGRTPPQQKLWILVHLQVKELHSAYKHLTANNMQGEDLCTVIDRKNRETGVKGDGVKPQQVRIILSQGVRSDRQSAAAGSFGG